MKWNPDGKKEEIWMKGKSKWYVAKVNLKLSIAKFNRQTHGFGIMMILMMFVLFVYLGVQSYLNYQLTHIEPNPEVIHMEKIARCMQYHTCLWST